MNGAGNGQREKVLFPINEPVVLRLDYDDGQPTQGRFGDQFQYTFDNGSKIAWLDPEVRALIQQTGALAGDEIAIAKREAKGQGGRKRVTWEVEKVEDEANAAYNAEAEARATQDTRPRAARASAPRSAPTAPRAPARGEQIPLDNAREEFTVKAARLFADCIAAALHAAKLSEDEAAELSIPIQWEQADIRAIATTIYINATGGKK